MLALVFSSSAKFLVLQLLSNCSSPLSLRKISTFSKLPVRSVQLALQSLTEQKIITFEKVGNQKRFSLRRDSEIYEAVIAMFSAAERILTTQSQELHLRKGAAIINFINQVRIIDPKRAKS